MENDTSKLSLNQNPTLDTTLKSQPTLNIPETQKPLSPQTKKPKKYLFVLIILLIFLITLLYWLKINSYKILEKAALPTSIPTTTEELATYQKELDSSNQTPNSEQVDINWITHTEDELGFSFKIPEGWNFVSGRSNGSVDFDIVNPDKTMFVGIAFYVDKRIVGGMDISEVLAEKEGEIKSSEVYDLTTFNGFVEKNEVGYVAQGKKWYLNFANENAWEEQDGIIYDFEERVTVKNDGKIIYLQSMVLPGGSMDTVATKIMDSFVLK